MNRELIPGSFWRHTKRQTAYELIGVAKSQVDENESDMVIYKSVDDGQLWVRPVNKFLDEKDGVFRFEKVKESPVESVLS